MMEKQNKSKVSLRDIILIIFIVLVTVIIIQYINKAFEKKDRDIEILTNAEVVAVKNFVVDWYLAFDDDEVIAVSRNQLSFNSGQHPLTFSVNRLRAIYPDGRNRFITFNYVSYIDFYQDNDKVLCVISYTNSGRYSFELK